MDSPNLPDGSCEFQIDWTESPGRGTGAFRRRVSRGSVDVLLQQTADDDLVVDLHLFGEGSPHLWRVSVERLRAAATQFRLEWTSAGVRLLVDGELIGSRSRS